MRGDGEVGNGNGIWMLCGEGAFEEVSSPLASSWYCILVAASFFCKKVCFY